jgi:hypothetical protein
MVSDLSERARKDGEDVTQVVRECDELRRRDAESHQQILNLQAELKKEKGLKLAVQEKVTALEAKAHQDTTVAERLCKEQDNSRQTATGPGESATAPCSGSAPSRAISRGRRSKSERSRVSLPGSP